MFKLPFFIFLSIFFTSCSSNLALKHFNKSEIETKAILYTKKADLYESDKHKLIFWATYLNPLDIKELSNKKEYFIISTYFTLNNEQSLLENDYKITLNNKKPLLIKELKENKYLSNKSPWGKEYLVEFKRYKSEKKMALTIKKNESTFTSLNFEK